MESGRVHGAAGDGAARRDRGVVVHGHRADPAARAGPDARRRRQRDPGVHAQPAPHDGRERLPLPVRRVARLRPVAEAGDDHRAGARDQLGRRRGEPAVAGPDGEADPARAAREVRADPGERADARPRHAHRGGCVEGAAHGVPRVAPRAVSATYDATPAVWEDAPGGGLDLPALGGEIEADVCAVGLGGSGLAGVRAAPAAGARLFERSAAIEIAGDAVRTAHGVVRCRGVVVAVDGALDRLLPELGPRVRTARLQMLATAPAREVTFPRPVYARWGYDYWQQLPNGAVALGGARDVGGETEWTHDARPTAPVQEALERLLRERLRVRAPIVRRWAALVAYSDTGLPILEEVRPNVWVCGAYSGTGNVLGELCGRAAARLAAGASDAATCELLELLRG